MSHAGGSRNAQHGERTIEISIRFWTNDIAETSGHVLPKHCWPSGTVSVPVNESHGLASSEPHMFNSLMELPGVIENALIASDIRMHVNKGKPSDYMQG